MILLGESWLVVVLFGLLAIKMTKHHQFVSIYPGTNGMNDGPITRLLQNDDQSSTFKIDFSLIFEELRQSKWFPLLMSFLTGFCVINLILGYWILFSLQLAGDGLGNGGLMFTTKGISIHPDAVFNKKLYTELISSHAAGKVILSGQRQLTLDGRDDSLSSVSSLRLNNKDTNRIELRGNQLLVHKATSQSDQPHFSIQSGEITTSSGEINHPSRSLKWENFRMTKNLETNGLTGDFTRDLRIESRTKSIRIAAPGSISIGSKAGDVIASSFKNITLSTQKLIFDSGRVQFSYLPSAKSFLYQEIDSQTTYQICVCESGLMFLAPGKGFCMATHNICSNG
ncbi:zeta-sarcoglycan-like [Brevipalpus obovatus]|uniref:zeta-sarcoglycan-like n=1 Tax=Brevipalpus obovatus TaxID=246614 RepID=UPI003D9E8B29